MNLYRNFGNLLESWASNTYPKVDTEDVVVLGSKQDSLSGKRERSKSRISKELRGTILRSESEDSGVEMACVEKGNVPSTPHGLVHSVLSIKEEEKCPAGEMRKNECCSSSPPSSVLSSCSCSSTSLNGEAQEKPEPLSTSLRVEQALWRAAQSNQRTHRKFSSWCSTLPSHYKGNSEPLNPCHTAPLPQCHSVTSSSRTGQRSGSLGSRRVAHPPTTTQRHGSSLNHPNPCFRSYQSDTPLHCGEEVSDTLLTEGLSPGLSYLEQVCRMLEEIARLQTRNGELRRENDRVHSQLKVQGLQDLCTQCSSKNEDSAIANQRTETERNADPISQSSYKDDPLSPCLRRRSVSDTKAFIRHVGRSEMQTQWNMSTGDLLERYDGRMQCEQPELQKQHSVDTLNLQLKTGSLKSEAIGDKASRQHPFSSGKNRPFRLLFKKRTKNMSAC